MVERHGKTQEPKEITEEEKRQRPIQENQSAKNRSSLPSMMRKKTIHKCWWKLHVCLRRILDGLLHCKKPIQLSSHTLCKNCWTLSGTKWRNHHRILINAMTNKPTLVDQLTECNSKKEEDGWLRSVAAAIFNATARKRGNSN